MGTAQPAPSKPTSRTTPSSTVLGSARAEHAPRAAFLFAGQGSQFVGMGAGLIVEHPEVARVVERCDAVFREEGLDGPSVGEVLAADRDQPHAALLDTARYAQPERGDDEVIA